MESPLGLLATGVLASEYVIVGFYGQLTYRKQHFLLEKICILFFTWIAQTAYNLHFKTRTPMLTDAFSHIMIMLVASFPFALAKF